MLSALGEVGQTWVVFSGTLKENLTEVYKIMRD